MKTKTPEYTKQFMASNPTVLAEFTNCLGQKVQLLEHPTQGDMYPVYAYIDGILADTEFFDIDDMIYEDSEYAPLLVDGVICCSYEID